MDIDSKEQEKSSSLLPTFGLFLANMVTFTFLSEQFHVLGSQNIPLSFISAGIYISGRIADQISTDQGFKIAKYYESMTGDAPFWERNPHINGIPDTREVYNRKKLLVDSLYEVSGLVFPPAGIIFGIGSFLAAIHNTKLRHELEKEIQSWNG